jgi:hypothetical protein
MANNNYKIEVKPTLSVNPHYATLSLKGDFSVAEIPPTTWLFVKDFCDQNGVRALLVEEDLSKRVKIVQIYELLNKIARYFRGMTIAYFDHQQDHAHLNSFAEDVSFNLGLRLRFFDDLKEANSFLTQDECCGSCECQQLFG